MSLAYSTPSTLSNRHREAPRFPCSVRVWVHDAASGRWAHMETVDVSKGGCSEGQGLQPGMGLRFLSADPDMVDKWLVAARCGRA